MASRALIPVAKRILLSLAISWFMAVSCGILFGACAVGTTSIVELWVMAVIPVATVFSSIVALALTPLVAWGFRSYAVVWWLVVLWLVMVGWILAGFALTHNGPVVILGALLLTVVGLFGVRFMGNR
jgi:hypothetical protein